MRNIQYKFEGKKLVLTIDLTQAKDTPWPPSQSGENLIIASSEGNAKLFGTPAGDIRLGVNVFTKNPGFVMTDEIRMAKARRFAGLK